MLRVRHVKCDEAKPCCIRCHKDRRKCDGYSTSHLPYKRRSSKSPSPSVFSALPALPDFDDFRQKEFFAFFVSCTSAASGVYFGENFWARRVLQLSLSEPSIRYALCSLSALHRTSTDHTITTPELQNYALQQYNQAVKRTQTLLAETSNGSPDKLIKGLVACVLFVCYENFTGNYHIATMHLQNGLRIITKEASKNVQSTIPKDIVHVFRRLDLQAIAFSDCRAPYPDHLYQEPLRLITTPATNFRSIEDCMDVVLRLCRWLFREASRSELRPCPVPSSDIQFAQTALAQWNEDIQHFLITFSTKPTDQVHRPIALLKMYQIIMTAIIATGIHGQETLHDAHLSEYQLVLDLGASLLPSGHVFSSTNQFFCFDIGVIFPLFWVATKCRDPSTRRRAITLLKTMHHQEGMWKSTTAAKVAEFVMSIEEEGLQEGGEQSQVEESKRVQFAMGMEEEGLRSGSCQLQVTEARRVHLVNMMADAERGEILVSCVMREGGDWYTRDGRVSYSGKEVLD